MIDHLDLVVTDFERSLEFYRGLLRPLGYAGESPITGERGERVHNPDRRRDLGPGQPGPLEERVVERLFGGIRVAGACDRQQFAAGPAAIRPDWGSHRSRRTTAGRRTRPGAASGAVNAARITGAVAAVVVSGVTPVGGTYCAVFRNATNSCCSAAARSARESLGRKSSPVA